MARLLALPALLLLAASNSQALAQAPVGNTAVINLGNYNLQPNQPNQTIQISVSGGPQVSGLNFNLQMGDGGPAHGGTPGPVFTNLDLVNGTIFQNDYDAPLDLGSSPQLLTWDIVTAGTPEFVSADGLLATATIDTTGFTVGQTFPISISNTLNGSTNFVFDGVTPVPTILVNGTITIVPEPSTILLFAVSGLCLCGRACWQMSRYSFRGQK